jgi:DNA polymerase-3 subunit alpha
LIKSGSFDAAYAGRGANRGSLLFALDAAMADGARLAADRKAGQGSLFDAFSGDGGAANGAAAAPVFLDPARAWDQRATLKAESEVLGFYLTGHPLEEQSGLFSILSTTSTRRVVELAGGSEVLLGGLIVQLKEQTTRAGKKMARFRLEDLHGGVAVTVFPRTFEANKEKLVDGALVLCRAKVEESAGEEVRLQVSLLLEEVLTLEEALERFEGGLVVHLDPVDRERLPTLCEALRAHRGKRRLFFVVNGADGRRRRVRASEAQGVRISADLVRDVGAALDAPGRVQLARF